MVMCVYQPDLRWRVDGYYGLGDVNAKNKEKGFLPQVINIWLCVCVSLIFAGGLMDIRLQGV
jgi:hypothetical protein